MFRANPLGPASGRESASTVFIVDDEYFVRLGLRAILELAGWEVVEFEACEAFLTAYKATPGSCLILDAHLPGMGGLELLRHLRGASDDLPVVMISGSSDIATAMTATRAGVDDFLEKPVSSESLVSSVGRALNRGYERREIAAEHRSAAARIALLTERQLEVLNLVVTGCPNKVIAYQLGISQRTVETHRAAVMSKTGAASIPALARLVSSSLMFLKASSESQPPTPQQT